MEICTSCGDVYPSNCTCEDPSPQACTVCKICGELIEGHTEDFCEYCDTLEDCDYCWNKLPDGENKCPQCGYTN